MTVSNVAIPASAISLVDSSGNPVDVPGNAFTVLMGVAPAVPTGGVAPGPVPSAGFDGANLNWQPCAPCVPPVTGYSLEIYVNGVDTAQQVISDPAGVFPGAVNPDGSMFFSIAGWQVPGAIIAFTIIASNAVGFGPLILSTQGAMT